jgi:hypothetical protein
MGQTVRKRTSHYALRYTTSYAGQGKTRHPPSFAKATGGREEIFKRVYCFSQKNKEEEIIILTKKTA